MVKEEKRSDVNVMAEHAELRKSIMAWDEPPVLRWCGAPLITETGLREWHTVPFQRPSVAALTRAYLRETT